jgi:hypothetical protein
MNPRLLIGGLKSYLPIPSDYKGTGGTVTGAYCYSVWLRHLSLIAKHAHLPRPHVLVEIGPGDSIGIGLAALLTGVDTYYGLDVLEHANVDTNLRVLDELVELFRRRAPIPDDERFPLLYPRLESYDFPHALIDQKLHAERLSSGYLDLIRGVIREPSRADGPIRYRCPWSADSVPAAAADLVLSQVALQDMDNTTERDDLATNIRLMSRWLKPGGVMSHQIDFSCPGGSPWNHHWAYSNQAWRLIRGRRPYYVNRAALSDYIRLFESSGCEVVGVERRSLAGLGRSALQPRFAQLPDTDLETPDACVIAVKR